MAAFTFIRQSMCCLGTGHQRHHKGWTEVGNYRDEHLELKDVKYRRRPAKVNAFLSLVHKFLYTETEDHYDVPLNIGGDAEVKEENIVGLVKYSDWRYEKEVRAFFPVDDAILPDARVLQVGLPNLKGVIFGPRMSCENKARAIVCCHLLVESHNRLSDSESRREFQFFQARQTVDRFGFQISPVGVLDKHYFDHHLPLKPVKDLDRDTVERLRAVAASIATSIATNNVSLNQKVRRIRRTRRGRNAPSFPKISATVALDFVILALFSAAVALDARPIRASMH